MATGMVLSVAQTLFAALQCKELRDVCSMFGYESQLDELKRTVDTIKSVLLDAESKQQELTNEGRDWVENLKDAVYDVDDLLDEFRTMVQQRQQMRDAKVSKKVRRFFSRSNKFLVALNTSQEIKKIKAKLDNIAKNRSDFGFGDTYEPVKRRVETSSYVREESIIGREVDKEIIINMLLSENEEDISIVTIVGIGGLGKTALAQLVFNDNNIKSAFSLKMWVCVSEDFSMKRIFSQMVEMQENNMEVLQRKAREKIEGKRYLLVLDDVWNEKRDVWSTLLRNFLTLGGKGSKILVTSCSKQVAKVIGSNLTHYIQGLSEQNSWRLFKRMAFDDEKEPEDSELVEIGKQILNKCANAPLAIRVIGSLLYGQDKSKWISFKSVDLSKMGEGKEGILPVLKYSYYHLSAPLKCCFSYCVLFPKDYVIEKQFLINLWMAQGFLDDGTKDGRSIEDVGEEFFSILLQRCFLQDIKKNVYDEIYSCKMHDLIHDLAQEVVGKEFSLVKTDPSNRKIRHMSIDDDRHLAVFAQKHSLDKMKNLRTILLSHLRSSGTGLDVTKILPHVSRARVVRLHGSDMKVIPKTLSNLVHLRYLEITGWQGKKIPNSITKLLNLKVMILSDCSSLEELPKDMGKLVNLRQLDIEGCRSLTHMPTGFDNLTCLHTLTMFVLGTKSSSEVEMGQLQDLKQLLQLRGKLKIVVSTGYIYDATNAEGGFLSNKSQLKALSIHGGHYYWKAEVTIDEGLLEVLEPHCNIRSIDIRSYKDTKLPNWAATMGSSLPLLVNLYLGSFPMLRHLPPLLSQLQHLKVLTLCQMGSVEYMVDDNNDIPLTQSSRRTPELTFFPSLEELHIYNFPKLKGWWRDDILQSMECGGQDGIPSFPRLHRLTILECPNMTSFPRCPHSHLKDVWLRGVDGLKFCKSIEAASGSKQTCVGESSSCSSKAIVSSNISSSSTHIDNNNHSGGFHLDWVSIDNIGMLKSLFGESLRVNTLYLNESKIERWSDARINEHLLNHLQHLEIDKCINLEMEEVGDGMMPWKALQSLTRLDLWGLPKMVNLPKGFQHLSSLKSLNINGCNNLEALPEWLDTLTSLQSLRLQSWRNLKSLPEAIRRLPSLTQLDIIECDSLRRRCTEPDREDCPKIRHMNF